MEEYNRKIREIWSFSAIYGRFMQNG